MDFLLLLPERRRAVLEVDGRHHYAGKDGRADPQRYATMVSEDRRLRLTGYEVYHFDDEDDSQQVRAGPRTRSLQNLSENRVETDVMGIVKRSMDHPLGQD